MLNIINDMALYLNSVLKLCLFADDTTIYGSCNNLSQLLSIIQSQLRPFLDWVKYNQLTINWSKTKLMFLTNKRGITFPSNFVIDKNSVEVVQEFRLLGVNIDNKLNFKKHVENVKCLVNRKLFSIKKIFYLSQSVKLQFFKTFILPHFDYCSSLVIHFSKTLLNNLENFFNVCIYHLFKKPLSDLTIYSQLKTLEELRIYPFKIRLFYRLNIFCYKIVNKQILINFYNKLVFNDQLSFRKRELVHVPFERTKGGPTRLSIFLPNFINNVLKNSFNLNINDFCNSLRDKIIVIYDIFIKSFSNF